ncbi:MAG: sensor histidine kinase [Isosphaeraceae bacterium]
MNAQRLVAMAQARWPIRYGIAIAIAAATIALLHVPAFSKLGHVLYLVVLLISWLNGLGPGLLSVGLFTGAALAAVVRRTDNTPPHFLALLFFFAGAAMIPVLVGALQEAIRRIESGRRWLSAVISSIGDAVIATDDRGLVLFMNPVAEALCGWLASEAAGRPLAEVFRIVNEHTRSPVENPVDRVLAEGVVVGLANHTILIARDGFERPIDDSGAPIRGVDGRITGVVLVFRDVTERREAEVRIAEEGRRKDEFLAMLAHELRNPLAAIANAVQLLLHPGVGDSDAWCREVIDRQVRQLTRLVDDLLDVSRISRGKIRLRPQRVDLAAIVRSAALVVRPLVDLRGHELRLAIEPDSIDIDADPVRLEQIVVNLLNNAAKYTEHGGRIAVEATVDGTHAVLRVADTGIGIAPELLPRVFELFTQGERALARSQGGLGIGLSMVQKLVELHGGRVEVHSHGPGRGSVFTVRLPVMPAPALVRDHDGMTGAPSPVESL